MCEENLSTKNGYVTSLEGQLFNILSFKGMNIIADKFAKASLTKAIIHHVTKKQKSSSYFRD
jgi:hypothetical protein